MRLRTGELARIIQRQGVWIRVVTSTDREGWIPADAVYPLSRD
jgi:hypothetical protein